ncbi:hypothetical protein [Acinetobacter proteolyticus]|uniref:Uncharacterized protein n=1 Tax=Acinetobacter proteolyticus TaxID=1776741 RepID=A0A2N0WID9_9GAMM|nr:hypothetical protein [Acinetobacter proteolyticus]PKF35533.1 hypothetical protein CW311_04385 [Acinetobacter proteolyticus]
MHHAEDGQRLSCAFTYNSRTRIFSCLGQQFSNVGLFEIEACREIAVLKYLRTTEQPDKPIKAESTPKKPKQAQKGNRNPNQKNCKHRTRKANGSRSVQAKLS